MTGVALIIAFVLAIIVMIVAISKFKVHPFLANYGGITYSCNVGRDSIC